MLARLAALASLLVVVWLAACSSGTATSTPGAGTTLTVTGAWVRPPMGAGQPAAAYMVIANPGTQADALLGVSVLGASSVEIHETSTDASGMTGMRPIDRLEVPAGGSVTLQPGGYHVMIMGLTEPPAIGSTFVLDLLFERAGTVTVKAEVRQG